MPRDEDHERLKVCLTRIIDREGLQAPTLLTFELGNAIHRGRPQRPTGSFAARRDIVSSISRWCETVAFDGPLMELAGQIAEQARISFYDASYLALTQSRSAILVTADSGLHAHAAALGIRSLLMPRDLDELERLHPPSHDEAS